MMGGMRLRTCFDDRRENEGRRDSGVSMELVSVKYKGLVVEILIKQMFELCYGLCY